MTFAADHALRPSLRTPIGVLVAGLVLGGGHLLVRFGAPDSKGWEMVGSALLLVGAAVGIGGLVGLFFKVATHRSFEWLISWRYLRVQQRRSRVTIVPGICLIAAAAVLMVLSYVLEPHQLDGLMVGPTAMQRILRFVSLGLFTLGHWCLFFGVLLLFFSVFTTISTFCVFLGLEALIAVLSMMGGFEADLRQKILGATAHVVITKPKQVFSDYRQVLGKVSRLDRVKGVSPYIESEVMITSQTNLSGVMLRGIDPKRIRDVTEIEKFLKAEGASGSLENLVHPERLARIPEARFRPLVSPPLGPSDTKEGQQKKEARKRKKGAEEKGEGSKRKKGGEEEKGEGSKTQEGTKTHKGKKEGPKPGDVLESELIDVEDEVGKFVPPRPIYPGIIIGAELAKNLRLYVGDDVNVVAPLGGMSPAGPIPKSKPFRVAGVFYSGLYEVDNKFAYVTIPAAQRFLGLDDEISGIEVKVARLSDAAPLAEAARRVLGNSGHKVEDWRQRNVNLFSALKLEKLVMFIVLGFIVLVASFSIVTNLNMVVLEKVREIAALKAMGAANVSLLKVFMYAGLYIGIIGMLIGVLSGVGVCTFLGEVGLPLDPEIYYISELPVRMNPIDIGIVAVGGVLLSFAATVYPALIAARLRPADGMRRHDV